MENITYDQIGNFDRELTIWNNKAIRNIRKWGKQNEETLILAMMEELGELSRAYLQHTHEEKPELPILKELRDLMALGIQFWRLIHGKVWQDECSGSR